MRPCYDWRSIFRITGDWRENSRAMIEPKFESKKATVLERNFRQMQNCNQLPAIFLSLIYDGNFVRDQSQSSLKDVPIFANERCGTWHIPTNLQASKPRRNRPFAKSVFQAGSVYFKSSDSHYGNWQFNLKRLNLHLLKSIAEMGGYFCSL